MEMATAADPAHARPIFLCVDATGGSPSSAPASASAPSPALYLPSPPPKRFMSRSRSLLRLPLHPSILPGEVSPAQKQKTTILGSR